MGTATHLGWELRFKVRLVHVKVTLILPAFDEYMLEYCIHRSQSHCAATPSRTMGFSLLIYTRHHGYPIVYF